MNVDEELQEHYLEETFKMRNLLEEFDSKEYGLPDRRPTILGVREHVFTGRCRHLLILHNF
jgi:callose synthase